MGVFSLVLIVISLLSALQCKVSRRTKSSKYVWKVAVMPDPVGAVLDKSEKEIVEGLHYKTFKTLQEKLQFRYELVKPLEKYYGSKLKNGTWNGIIGRTSRNEADICFNPAFQTYSRYEVVDFSAQVQFAHLVFTISAPHREVNWKSIFQPFTLKMWYSILISILIFGILLYLIMKKDFEIHGDKKMWSKERIYWYLFGSFTNQGADLTDVRGSPSRLLIGLWLLSTVVLVSAYSGVLMSFMTVPLFERTPRTFDELIEAIISGYYSCVLIKNNAVTTAILSAKEGNMKILGDEIRQSGNLLQDNFAALEKVLKENVAFVRTDSGLERYLKIIGRHNFFVSKDALVTYIASYVMRKNFPYKKDVNKILTRLFEAGITKHHEDEEGFDIDVAISSGFSPLNVQELLSPFLLLGCGYLISTICLVIEIVSSKVKKMTNDSIICTTGNTWEVSKVRYT